LEVEFEGAESSILKVSLSACNTPSAVRALSSGLELLLREELTPSIMSFWSEAVERAGTSSMFVSISIGTAPNGERRRASGSPLTRSTRPLSGQDIPSAFPEPEIALRLGMLLAAPPTAVALALVPGVERVLIPAAAAAASQSRRFCNRTLWVCSSDSAAVGPSRVVGVDDKRDPDADADPDEDEEELRTTIVSGPTSPGTAFMDDADAEDDDKADAAVAPGFLRLRTILLPKSGPERPEEDGDERDEGGRWIVGTRMTSSRSNVFASTTWTKFVCLK